MYYPPSYGITQSGFKTLFTSFLKSAQFKASFFIIPRPDV